MVTLSEQPVMPTIAPVSPAPRNSRRSELKSVSRMIPDNRFDCLYLIDHFTNKCSYDGGLLTLTSIFSTVFVSTEVFVDVANFTVFKYGTAKLSKFECRGHRFTANVRKIYNLLASLKPSVGDMSQGPC
jgi:hypothetical protein